jgi:periplasmic divalent cation tolerance protein
VSTPLVVFVTFPSLEVARRISSVLVGEGLAACANLLPGAESVYRWQGKVEAASEVVGLMKTTRERVAEMERRYLSLHPYEVAEFLVIEAVSGSQAYLDWLAGSVETATPSEPTGTRPNERVSGGRNPSEDAQE